MKKLMLIGLFLALPVPSVAQEMDMEGTWQAETPDGPQDIIIRPDSSASYGDETVRWRLEPDSILIAFGDEWVVYGIDLLCSMLVMSGGDLEDPIEFRKVGPASPLPEGDAVPPAPPADARAVL
jgi:hypothetical protein